MHLNLLQSAQPGLVFSHLNSMRRTTTWPSSDAARSLLSNSAQIRKDALPATQAERSGCPPADWKDWPALPLAGPPDLSLPAPRAGMQRKRRGHRLPPLNWWPRLELPASLPAATNAIPAARVIAFFDCGDELFSVSCEIEYCANMCI